MEIVILAGGLGTRLSEETSERPKPMVLINQSPIIWHLMKIFRCQGLNSFTILTGHLSEIIDQWLSKEFIAEFGPLLSIVDQKNLKTYIFENLQVRTLFTGIHANTSLRLQTYFEYFPHEQILVTYGDGLANVNVSKLLKFHRKCDKTSTLTAVHPPARFGALEIEGSTVKKFSEKESSAEGWINGGFIILEPEFKKYLAPNDVSLEGSAFPLAAKNNDLAAHFHDGFWRPMDTLREKHDLEILERDGSPWLDIRSS